MIDDETLMRRADGLLDGEDAAEVDRAAAADPELARRLAAFGGQSAALRQAWPEQADPRDQALARLIGGQTASKPLGEGWLAKLFRPRAAAAWGGLATACFLGGLVVGGVMDRSAPGLALGDDGRLADAGLVRVLDQRLAADGSDDQGRAVGLSFQDADGDWCRTFSFDGLAGLACRQDGDWRLRAAAPVAAGGEVRQASSDIPAVILAAVDEALAGGDVADAAAERAARSGGWLSTTSVGQSAPKQASRKSP